MVKAYSYIRFSTDQQKYGDSDRRQVSLAAEYTKKHNMELDSKLNLVDVGVSAYRGKHATEGALSDFIEAIDQGLVEKGSFLLVENFDRFSRQVPRKAFKLFLKIIESGVGIITVYDKRIYSTESLDEDGANYYLLLSGLIRAHEESKRKSYLLSKTWEGKRNKIQQGVKLTSKCPAWLKFNKVSGEFEKNHQRVLIVKQIFQMTVDGLGKTAITKYLNERNTLTFGKSKGWQQSYIQKILESKSVLGYFQPKCVEYVGGKRTRKNVGDVIEDYFPQIIDEQLFEKAKNSRLSRKNNTGRKGKGFTNLLTGLCLCGNCGNPIHYVNKGSKIKGKKGKSYLVCSAAIKGLGVCKYKSFDYEICAFSILSRIKKVDYQNIFPKIYEKKQDEIDDFEKNIYELNKEKSRLEIGIKNLIEAITKTGISDYIEYELINFKSIEEQNNIKISDLQEKLSTIKLESEGIESRFKEVLAFNVAAVYLPKEEDSIQREKLNKSLKKLISKIYLYHKAGDVDSKDVSHILCHIEKYNLRMKIYMEICYDNELDINTKIIIADNKFGFFVFSPSYDGGMTHNGLPCGFVPKSF
jgi:DNA invertase Pin-like site-specific DNA recombinase